MSNDTYQDVPLATRLAEELQETKAKLALLVEERFYMLHRVRVLEGELRKEPSNWPDPLGMN